MPEKSKTLPARLKRLLESKRITIKLRDEKGQDSMAQSVLEQMGVQIDESARKASRAASAVADALEDGGETARRVTKQGSHAAAELLADTKSEYNGIRLKQSRQHLRPALWLERRSAG